MEAYSLLVNLRKGMQSSSEQPLVGEERYLTILTTAAKETRSCSSAIFSIQISSFNDWGLKFGYFDILDMLFPFLAFVEL